MSNKYFSQLIRFLNLIRSHMFYVFIFGANREIYPKTQENSTWKIFCFATMRKFMTREKNFYCLDGLVWVCLCIMLEIMVWKQTILCFLTCFLLLNYFFGGARSIITWETLLIVCHVNFFLSLDLSPQKFSSEEIFFLFVVVVVVDAVWVSTIYDINSQAYMEGKLLIRFFSID
jgi:hypothetical protein